MAQARLQDLTAISPLPLTDQEWLPNIQGKRRSEHSPAFPTYSSLVRELRKPLTWGSRTSLQFDDSPILPGQGLASIRGLCSGPGSIGPRQRCYDTSGDCPSAAYSFGGRLTSAERAAPNRSRPTFMAFSGSMYP